jgi:hypothetical protein
MTKMVINTKIILLQVFERRPVVMLLLIIAMAATRLFLLVPPAFSEIYQWTDAHGNTVYSDSPPAGVEAKPKKLRTDRIEKPDTRSPEARTARTAKETPRKRDLRDVTVILYAADW